MSFTHIGNKIWKTFTIFDCAGVIFIKNLEFDLHRVFMGQKSEINYKPTINAK